MPWLLAVRKKKLLRLHQLLLFPHLHQLLLQPLLPLPLLTLLPLRTLQLLLAPLLLPLLPLLPPPLRLLSMPLKLLLPLRLLHPSNQRLLKKPTFGSAFFLLNFLFLPQIRSRRVDGGMHSMSSSRHQLHPRKSFLLTGNSHISLAVCKRSTKRVPGKFRGIVMLA